MEWKIKRVLLKADSKSVQKIHHDLTEISLNLNFDQILKLVNGILRIYQNVRIFFSFLAFSQL